MGLEFSNDEDYRQIDFQEAVSILYNHRLIFSLNVLQVDYVSELGRRLLEKNPRLAIVKESLIGLEKEMMGAWITSYSISTENY